MAIVQIFSKQHLNRGNGREEHHVNKSLGKKGQKMSTKVTRNYVNTPSVRHNSDLAKKEL